MKPIGRSYLGAIFGCLFRSQIFVFWVLVFWAQDFVCFLTTLGSSEVLAWLQWAKALQAHGGKPPLYVNMDETSVAYSFTKGKGLVISQKACPPGKKHRKQKISSADDKRRVSLLACLTNDPEVQPKLPQVILGNEASFTLDLLKKLKAHTPGNYHLIRGKSSWNSHAQMRDLICLIAKSLEGYMETHQVILVMDVAKCHFQRTISALATKKGIRLLYVPAKCTWLLQPADTHCFALLKGKLREEWGRLRSESVDGTISHQLWLCTVMSVTQALLNGTKWGPAFQAAGLLGEARLSQRVLDQLGWESHKPIADLLPSDNQLKLVFPTRSKFSRASLFSWFVPKAKAKPKAKGKAKAKALAAHAAPMLD